MKFDYVIFRYSDENNNTSPYIIITKLLPDCAVMIWRIGRKHPRKNFLYYIRDNIMTDSDICLSTSLECIKPDLRFRDVYKGIGEIGKGWLEINLRDGYKINYYREVHCL